MPYPACGSRPNVYRAAMQPSPPFFLVLRLKIANGWPRQAYERRHSSRRYTHISAEPQPRGLSMVGPRVSPRSHTNYCSLWPVDVGRRTHVIRIATAWPVDGRPPRVATLIRIIAARGSVDVGRRTHVLRIATAWPVDGRPPRVATSYPNAHSKRAGGAPGGTRCADRRQGHR
jgi:hypothetical protein